MNDQRKFVLLLIILIASIALVLFARAQIGGPFIEQLRGN
jgi:hypothetical protein